MNHFRFFLGATALLVAPFFCPSLYAQDVVHVGAGSYASHPPADEEHFQEFIDKPLYVVDLNDRPVPTNDWWTDLLVSKFGTSLWAFPLKIDTFDQGLRIFYPTRWNDEGRDPVSEFPMNVGGENFHPADARAVSWGDWTLKFRMAESDTKFVDVTIGRGLPYVWLQYVGVQPTMKLPTGDVHFFDRDGSPVSLPTTTDVLGLTFSGRSFAMFLPLRTRIDQNGDQLKLIFSGQERYAVICPLPKPRDITTFARFADAIPIDSKLTWTYDPGKGAVATTWTLLTKPLRGSEKRLIQGWIPHHYRHTGNDLKFSNLEYLTPRGLMKCATASENAFHISWKFSGIVPNWPAPKKLDLPDDFDEGRMRDYLKQYAEKTDYGNDTYWGGKDVLRLAKYMLMAQQMNDPSFTALRDTLRKALSDWFTYTPGEKEHYFARYPKWKALVGFNVSYGSEGFNDHHFHYGYFTMASAMLCMVDEQFMKDYGPMAKLVAREYAGWEHDDKDYPFLRTFDPWAGHSWAGGTGGGGGNNQESSSEAVQSWAGLFLLGVAMNDEQMTAAGAMGYAIETEAVRQYWLDVDHVNWSPNYKHPIVGMIWSGGQLYGTYFSGDPAWIHGIQWLPEHPMLSYLVTDRDYARRNFEQMLADRKIKEGKNSISSMGDGLGNVVLGYELMFDPDAVCRQMDDLWNAGDPVARKIYTGGLTYYYAHARRMIGLEDPQWRTTAPASGVYLDPRTQQHSVVIYNANDQPATYQVYHNDQPMTSFTVPGRSLNWLAIPP